MRRFLVTVHYSYPLTDPERGSLTAQAEAVAADEDAAEWAAARAVERRDGDRDGFRIDWCQTVDLGPVQAAA